MTSEDIQITQEEMNVTITDPLIKFTPCLTTKVGCDILQHMSG